MTYYFQDASGLNCASVAARLPFPALRCGPDIANVQFARRRRTPARRSSPSSAAQPAPALSRRERSRDLPASARSGTTNVWHWNADTSINIETTAVGNGFGPINADPNVAGGHAWATVVHEEGHEIGLGLWQALYNGDVAPATQQFQRPGHDAVDHHVLHRADRHHGAILWRAAGDRHRPGGTTGPGGSGFACRADDLDAARHPGGAGAVRPTDHHRPRRRAGLRLQLQHRRRHPAVLRLHGEHPSRHHHLGHGHGQHARPVGLLGGLEHQSQRRLVQQLRRHGRTTSPSRRAR